MCSVSTSHSKDWIFHLLWLQSYRQLAIVSYVGASCSVSPLALVGPASKLVPMLAVSNLLFAFSALKLQANISWCSSELKDYLCMYPYQMLLCGLVKSILESGLS